VLNIVVVGLRYTDVASDLVDSTTPAKAFGQLRKALRANTARSANMAPRRCCGNTVLCTLYALQTAHGVDLPEVCIAIGCECAWPARHIAGTHEDLRTVKLELLDGDCGRVVDHAGNGLEGTAGNGLPPGHFELLCASTLLAHQAGQGQ
jgi:hypothetical protein